MDRTLIPRMLSLLGYRNSCAWTAQNHNGQITKKLKQINDLRDEIRQHQEHVDHANAEVSATNKGLDILLNAVPPNRAVEVAGKLFNATDDDTDDATCE